MHTVKTIPVDQGEVNIRKIDALPEGMKTKPVERSAKGHIISHSEQGHHHLLLDGDVIERTDNVPTGMRKLYAILDKPSSFIQDAPAAHEGYALSAGIYEFRIAREYNPFTEQARLVAD